MHFRHGNCKYARNIYFLLIQILKGFQYIDVKVCIQ